MGSQSGSKAKIPPRVNVRVLRQSKGWSIADLMERMEEFGVSPSDPAVIRMIETGNRRPGPKMHYAMAKALGLDPAELILPPPRCANGNGKDAA